MIKTRASSADQARLAREATRTRLSGTVPSTRPTKVAKAKKPSAQLPEEMRAHWARKHTHEGVRRALDTSYREDLFRISSDAPNPKMPLKWVIRLARPFLRLNLGNTWVRLQHLTSRDAMLALLAGWCEVFDTPQRFVGGNDNARGFGSGGSEWPQLAALVAGADYRSDTTVRDWFIDLEEALAAYRKQMLEYEPWFDESIGRERKFRFQRNHVYLASETLVRWYRNPLLDAWVKYLRRELNPNLPTSEKRISDLTNDDARKLWAMTNEGRRWQRSTYSYRDAIELSKEERKERSRRRSEAADKARKRKDQLRRWKRVAEERAANRDRPTEGKKVTDPSVKTLVKTPPISPFSSSSSKKKREERSAGAGKKVGPTGPAPAQGPPVGRPVITGPPRDVEAGETQRKPEIEERYQDEISTDVPAATSHASGAPADPPPFESSGSHRRDKHRLRKYLDEHGPSFRRVKTFPARED